MSISSTTRTAGPFSGNGTVSTFPFAFKIFQAADLLIVQTANSTRVPSNLVLGTHYFVSLNSDQNNFPGGSITLVAGALAAGLSLSITSNMPNLQPTSITNAGGFYPAVINDALDRLTILIQQMQVSINNVSVQPCQVITPGFVYTAPGTVLAVFVNGLAAAPTDYTAVGSGITFNYWLYPGDVVYALCPGI